MIDRIAPTDVELFHLNYVKSRVPCILTAIPTDLLCLESYADLDYLRRRAGEAKVTVEPISKKGTFGTAATKQEMTFGHLLEKLQRKDKVYLTTQYTEDTDELETPIFDEPLVTLRKAGAKFPIVPCHAEGLLTAKINLWLGASQDGTTSGLHHDSHENFYILLSGRKRFRIFKPSWKACQRLQIHGKPHEIHPNGLITYNGSIDSDGLSNSYKAQVRVDVRERDLHAARQSGVDVDACESRYEEAMDKLLQYTLQDDAEVEDGEFDSPEDNASNTTSDDDVASHDGSNGDEGENLASNGHDAASDTSQADKAILEADGTSEEEPPSFSKLNQHEVAEILNDRSLESCEFVLERGELLYLPASYFHEVISMSGDQDFHMAVNFWFYPPDSDDGKYRDAEVFDELKRRSLQVEAENLRGEDDRPQKRRRR